MTRSKPSYVVLPRLLLKTALGALLGLAAASPCSVLGGERFVLDPLCMPGQLKATPLPPGKPAPGTVKMAQWLQRFYEASSPTATLFWSDRVAGKMASDLASTTNALKRLNLLFALGLQQTQAGRPDLALNAFADMEEGARAIGFRFDEKTRRDLRLRKAMAFLRLGEQENCLLTHNAESCVFPLRPKAFHQLPRGSRGALTLLNEHLGENPEDLGARWLVNIAHMTLGEYPDKVPPALLIPPKAFASEYELPRFVDVSSGLGLDLDDLAGGVILDDFDNDGLTDLMVSAWDFSGQLRYFHNKGDGTFTQRTSEAGLVGEVAALNIQQTDYNNDGNLDLWLLRGGWFNGAGRLPKSLLRNNGDGTFTDVTEEAGLLSLHPTQTSRWFDYDGDGWLDVFIGHESSDPNTPDWCELYHNNRDGTFTECAELCSIRIAAFVKGVACADYDNDGRPDLYLSIRDQSHVLLHNDGPDKSGQWHFSDATERAGIPRDVFPSFGTFFFDYDNDGWEDLLVFGYSIPKGVGEIAADALGLPNGGRKPRLYHNNHDGTFTDVSERMGLNRIVHAMGHNFGDLDNDGWLDFYAATGDPDLRTLIPNRMFRNAEGRGFQDVTTATGTGSLQKGHAVGFADLNNDGGQDIYVSLGGAYTGDFARNALFLNPGSTNHWIKLKLTGVKANRAAIGARIRVNVKTPTGTREIHRTVNSGGSFGSNPLRQEIGLGSAISIESVEIRWPGSDLRQTVKGMDLDQIYEIREGDSVPKKVQRPRFSLTSTTPSTRQ